MKKLLTLLAASILLIGVTLAHGYDQGFQYTIGPKGEAAEYFTVHWGEQTAVWPNTVDVSNELTGSFTLELDYEKDYFFVVSGTNEKGRGNFSQEIKMTTPEAPGPSGPPGAPDFQLQFSATVTWNETTEQYDVAFNTGYITIPRK